MKSNPFLSHKDSFPVHLQEKASFLWAVLENLATSELISDCTSVKFCPKSKPEPADRWREKLMMYLDWFKRFSASKSSLPALIQELDFRHPNHNFQVSEEA